MNMHVYVLLKLLLYGIEDLTTKTMYLEMYFIKMPNIRRSK
jgi:hypothetical protein